MYAVATLVVGVTFGTLACTHGEEKPIEVTIVTEGKEASTTDQKIHFAVSGEQPIDPRFTLSRAQLTALIANEERSVQISIAGNPERFLSLAYELLALDVPAMALVDKTHALPADYAPDDLIDLSTLQDRLILNKAGLSLREVIMPDLFAMVKAAREDNILLDLSSTYRSYDYQVNLFDYWVNELGQEEAERVSARPGTSQHQLGTTIDFGSVTKEFADHPAGVWLGENAHRFGFSLSFPQGLEEYTGYDWEPWHFRWISPAGTQMEREFFGGVQQRMMLFWDAHHLELEQARTLP